ncbi:Vacuolar ATP synthase subunit C [Blastocladiella emersonii ATCC 22665]|nr:Vacuolar ATP synthase subunit C [Blastocladiella emersonii ATCC 22665]
MGKFWLVSLPAAGNKQDRLNHVKGALAASSSPLADVSNFIIPDLKVGTLDSLVKLSDDLAKIDAAAEVSSNKLVDLMKTLLNGDVKQVEATLVVGNRSTDDFVRSFSWNAMKYRIDKPLREIVDAIQQEVAQIDSTMKARANAYNQIKGNLQAMERKMTGNLSVRSLVEIVRKEHFVLDSEYLTTLLVAVPRQSYQLWESSYETLTQMVVPRSTQKIAEDEEYGLFTVTLFQRVADEFTNKCRELKFTPREYKFDEKDLEQTKRQRQELQTLEKEHWGQLLRLTKTNFSELFACWVHIKAVRIFVESVLRYGLPPDFVVAAIEPTAPKHEKKIRTVLNGYFNAGGLGGVVGKDSKELDQEFEEMSLIAGVEKEFNAYVSFPLAFKMQ